MRKPALLIAAALTMLFTSAAIAANGAASIKLIEPIRIPDTKTVTGMFDGLGPDALAAGLGEARVHADVSQANLGGDRTRVTITWHSISKTDGANTATRQLQPPLSSQVVTTEPEIAPTTAMTARGDLAQVMRTYEAVVAELDAKARESVVNNNTTNNTTNTSNDDVAGRSTQNGLPLGGSGGIGAPESPSTDGSGKSPTDNDDRSGPDSARGEWVACTPRIDRNKGLVFARAKEVVKNSSGAIVSEKSCTDTGDTAPIKRDYEAGCQKMVDYDRRLAYPRYTTYAVLAGERIEVDGCTVDMDKGIDVLASFEGCSVRHDFPAKRSVQQEFLYYVEGGKQVPVSECMDSNLSYEHYLTTTTCTPTVDQANGHVWINKRVAYTKPDGTVDFASDCKPQSDSAVPIETEVCENKYEHVFNVGQSYLRTREYYVDDKGVRQYISQCTRDTTTAFEHKYTMDGCEVIHDDEHLLTRWQSKTVIETADDGVLEIASCQERTSPTPYVFIEETYKNKSKTPTTRPYGERSANDLINSAFSVNWNDPTVSWSGNFAGKPWPTSSRTSKFFMCIDVFGGNASVTETITYRSYKRGDGSTYTQKVKTHYKVSVVCNEANV